jgi:AbrB family looped-hinge helix DNA binding protein
MSIVRIKTKGQVTLPTAFRLRAGLKIGDLLRVDEKKGKIVLTPQTIIDRRLAEALADVKAGRTYGPFDSADEMIKDMKRRVKKIRNKK